MFKWLKEKIKKAEDESIDDKFAKIFDGPELIPVTMTSWDFQKVNINNLKLGQIIYLSDTNEKIIKNKEGYMRQPIHQIELITPIQRSFLEKCNFPDIALSIIRACRVTDEYFLTLDEFKNLNKNNLDFGKLIFIKDSGQIFIKIENKMEELKIYEG